jgi:hypothetical protein
VTCDEQELREACSHARQREAEEQPAQIDSAQEDIEEVHSCRHAPSHGFSKSPCCSVIHRSNRREKPRRYSEQLGHAGNEPPFKTLEWLSQFLHNGAAKLCNSASALQTRIYISP